MVEISTSILSIEPQGAIGKFYNLEVAHTDYFHIDVMDGKFVQANTKERMLEFTTSIKHITNIPLDVHLMVEQVKEEIEEYLAFEPQCITFHYEATKNKQEMKEWIEKIKQQCQVGISIKPGTNVEEIYEFLPYIHRVLVMTVEPGKGGQKLIPETIEKIRTLKEKIKQENYDVQIEADGGIGLGNMKELVEAGLDIAVVGSSITNTEDYTKTIKELKEKAK